MACRSLVLTCLLVGLVVAPPPGPPPHGPPPPPLPQGPPPPPPGSQPPGPGYDLGAPASEDQVSSDVYNDAMNLETQMIQQNGQTPAYGLTAGQILSPQPQANNLLGQGFYQPSFKPQDGISSPQSPGMPVSEPQVPAYLLQNPAYHAFLHYQMSQKPYSSQPYGQGPQGYMPSMYPGHMPMVIEAPHDFTPFSAGYTMGLAGYGLPHMYGQTYAQGPQTYPQGLQQGHPMGQTYPQGPQQGYPMGQTYPQGPQQGYPMGQTYPQGPQHGYPMGQTYPQGPQQGYPMGQTYPQGLISPNAQGGNYYTPAQRSGQKLPQAQINGKIQSSQ